MADQFWQPYWNNVDRRREDTRYQNALARQDMLDQRAFKQQDLQNALSVNKFAQGQQQDFQKNLQNVPVVAQRILDAPDNIKPAAYQAALDMYGLRGRREVPQQWGPEAQTFVQSYAATAEQPDPYEDYGGTPQNMMMDGQEVLAYTAPGKPPLPVGRAPQRTPLVEVNTGDRNPLPAGPGNKKFLETTGTLQANRLDELTKQAQSAIERQYGIQVQRSNIEQGLKTGAFAPLVNAVASYADGLGINPESLNLPDPTKGQVFNVATFDNLLKALQAQKGPQTEGDAERALKTFASLKNTEEANMFILDYMDALATRTQDMAEFVDNAAYGRYASSNRPVSLAEKEFRQWARQTPLVAKSQKTGLPITYYEYKKAAIANGIPEGKVDQEWRKFAGVK